MLHPRVVVRLSHAAAISAILFCLAIFASVRPCRGQTLTWDPLKNTVGSDSSGNWDTTAGNNVWSSGGADGIWVNGDVASIGDATSNVTTSPLITIDAAGGVTVGGITFNALGAGSTVGYTINDGSGTGADPLVVNSGSVITDNNTRGVTTINANLANSAAFGMTIAGSGNLTIGGDIGVVNSGAAALTIGNTSNVSPQFFSGTLSINSAAPNNVSATTINSGTVVAGNTTAFGAGTVTINGGSLRLNAATAAGGTISGFGGTSSSATGAGTPWTVSNTVIASNPINSNVMTLTDGVNGEARAAYYNAPIAYAGGFTASFQYTPVTIGADGFAFVLQNDPRGAGAPVAATGGGLGYAGIGAGAAGGVGGSVAILFNIYNGNDRGTGLAMNGGVPGVNLVTTNATNNFYTSNGASNNTAAQQLFVPVAFLGANTDPMNVTLTYVPPSAANLSGTLSEKIVDANNSANTFTTAYNINLANVLGNGAAYLGFTGSTGATNATQTIGNFSYMAGGGYANNVNLAGGVATTIDIAGVTPTNPTVAMGQLTVGAGSSHLNVTASTVNTAGQAYGLSFGNTTLSGGVTFNLANSAGGGGGTLTLANVSDGASAGSINLTGTGSLFVSGYNSYSGGTTAGPGATISVANNFALGTGGVTLSGGKLQAVGTSPGSVPVAGTGWNQDVIWALGQTAPTAANGVGAPAWGQQTAGGLDGGNYFFYVAGTTGSAAGSGLAPGRTIVSVASQINQTGSPSVVAPSLNTTFQLQPYGTATAGALNALQLSAGTFNNFAGASINETSGALALTNPAAFKTISVLSTVGGGAAGIGTYTMTLNFSNGTNLVVNPSMAQPGTTVNASNQITNYDWFDNAGSTGFPTTGTGWAIAGFGRYNGAFSGPTANPKMFEQDFAVPVADQNLPISSITFGYGGAGARVNIFGVSGAITAPAYNNSLSVTASSAIDVTGPSATTLSGAAGIGNTGSTSPITLSITGGSTGANAAYSFYLGTYPGAPSSGAGVVLSSGVALSGGGTGTAQYIFDVANNGSGSGTLFLGPLSDNGNASTVTLRNAGSVVLNYAGTMVAGSTISVGSATGGPNGATLTVGNSSGSATGSAAVNITGGGSLAVTTAALQGIVAGLATVKSGGTILGASGTQLFTGGGLTLQSGSISNFTLGASPNGTSSAMIAASSVSGTSLSITGAHTINLSGASVLPTIGGTYDLFSYTGAALTTTAPSGTTLTFTNGGGGSMTLGASLPQPGTYVYSLANNSAQKQIDLIVSVLQLTWTGRLNGNGAPANTWDTATNNWANQVPAAVNFTTATAVKFQDKNPITNGLVPNTSGVATVNVQSGGIQPTSVEFDNTGAANGGVDYLIAGGAIADSSSPTPLLLAGNGSVGGSVFLTSSNTFSGPVSVTLGTLVLENATALGNSSGATVLGTGGAILLQQATSGSSLTFGGKQNAGGTIGLTLSGTGTAANQGALSSGIGNNTYSGPISLGAAATIAAASTAIGDGLTLTGGINLGSATLTFAGSGSTTVSINPITDAGSSGSIVKAGGGTLTLAAANFYFGATSINSGSLVLQNVNGLGNSSGATVAAGAALVLPTVSGVAATYGNFTNGLGAVPLTLNGSGVVSNPVGALSSPAGINTYTGAIGVGASGAATIFSGSTANGDQLTLNGGINIPGGATLTFAGPGNSNIAPNAAGGAGAIGGGGTLAMGGTGTLNISALNSSFSGNAVLNNGTTVLSSLSALGTGTVVLNSARLRLTPSAFAVAGFGGNGAGWTVNSAGIASAPFPAPDVLQLTDNGGGEARSAFLNTPQSIAIGSTGFTASFTYTPSGTIGADGVAFILQNDSRGPSALGGGGGQLGYNGITPSAGLEINIYAPNTVGTTFKTNGATGGYVATTPVNVNSGDAINVLLSYNPATNVITETDTDPTANTTYSTNYPGINLATVLGGNSAYIGFSGATGGAVSIQQISNFVYSIPAGSTASFGNNVVLTAGSISTIDVAATAATSSFGMGTLTVNSGGTSTLNVTAATAPAGQAYGLTLGATTLNSNVTFNVANNGAGLGSLTLGAINGGFGITTSGPGTVVLAAANSYTGNTTLSGGTLRLADGSANNIAGSALIAVGGGGHLDVAGLASGNLVLGAGTIAQTLSGAGTVTGGLTVSAGSAIAGGSGSTLTVTNGVTLQNGSLASFALGTPNGSGSAPAAFINITGGGLTVIGAHAVNLSGAAQVGTYDIYAFTSGAPTANQFGVGTSTAGNFKYTFNVIANQEVDLVVAQIVSSATWNFNGNGNYNDNTKWSPALLPNDVALTATFGNGASNVVSAPNVTVTVDGADVVGALAFTNSNGTGYILGNDGIAGHGITLNNNGAGAAVSVAAGVTAPQTVFTNLTLAENTTFTTATNTSLLVSVGSIGESGSHSLTKAGAGLLTIDTPSSYSGGTIVSQGTLTVTGTGSIGTGSLEVDGLAGNVSVVNLQNSQTVTALSGSVSGAAGAATVNVIAGQTLTVNQASGSATFAGSLALAAGGSPATGGALVKSGGGTEILTAAPQLGNGTALNVNGGTLRINVASGSASVGSGVTSAVSGTGVLELAGAVSALGTAIVADRVDFANSSTAAAGLLVSAGNQQVGGIDGSGNVQVNAGASLTANHITAGALVIGGTPGVPATVVIDASNTNGSPTDETSGLALAGSLAPTAPFATDTPSASSLFVPAGLSAGGSSLAGLAQADFNSGNSRSAVPEPSTCLLLAIGMVVFLFPTVRRRLARR
jgi:fibronectin-binding autotransporter adhesin